MNFPRQALDRNRESQLAFGLTDWQGYVDLGLGVDPARHCDTDHRGTAIHIVPRSADDLPLAVRLAGGAGGDDDADFCRDTGGSTARRNGERG